MEEPLGKLISVNPVIVQKVNGVVGKQNASLFSQLNAGKDKSYDSRDKCGVGGRSSSTYPYSRQKELCMLDRANPKRIGNDSQGRSDSSPVRDDGHLVLIPSTEECNEPHNPVDLSDGDQSDELENRWGYLFRFWLHESNELN